MSYQNILCNFKHFLQLNLCEHVFHLLQQHFFRKEKSQRHSSSLLKIKVSCMWPSR